jgi:isohexenylglutaconyl-CoA hydratase
VKGLPRCEALLLREERSTLYVTFNRPEVRNAMTLAMLAEVEAVVDAAKGRPDLRTLVLRGADGHFCAGADIKDMAAARAEAPTEGRPDPLAVMNRRFGTMITCVDRAPQAVVAVLEGAVMGGGMGLACVADVAIARSDASFRLPETSLGVPPAQIAPFLMRRLGLSQARRLAVTGGRFDGREAHAIGLVHHVCEGAAALERTLSEVVAQIGRCAPGAIAITKRIMMQARVGNHDELLDEAAREFATAARGKEGEEGMRAFLQKRPPSWADED